jgi:hypothetical protein
MCKQYFQPEIKTYPITAMTVLCSSVENSGIGGEGNGGSQGSSRAPRRTEVF